MKTHDEIKKGLECCNQFRSGGHWNICSKCPYDIGKGRCYGTLETDALTYIVQLEAQVPRWISVEERLPENEVSVIAYSREDGHPWQAFRRGGLWWRAGDRLSIKIYGTVTHWMPLPEPPKD